MDLEAIRERADKATPGPWQWVEKGVGEEWTHHGPDLESATATVKIDRYVMPVAVLRSWGHDADGLEVLESDQEFIAHAREDIPALIAEVERLRGLLAIAAKSYANTISSEWHDMTPEEAMAEWEQATDQR